MCESLAHVMCRPRGRPAMASEMLDCARMIAIRVAVSANTISLQIQDEGLLLNVPEDV